jgi:hypothetical protein
MMTKTLSALAVVASLAFSGLALADAPAESPAKPVVVHKAHKPVLKKAMPQKSGEAPPASKGETPAAPMK